MIVMLASFITTFFMSTFEQPSSYYSIFYISPYEVAQDLVAAALRVIRDGDASILDDGMTPSTSTSRLTPKGSQSKPGLVKRFIRRFVLGLPLVGAGSLVQMLISFQFLAPIQMLARYRGRRNRRDSSSRDMAALIVVGLLILGAARYTSIMFKFSEFTFSRQGSI